MSCDVILFLFYFLFYKNLDKSLANFNNCSPVAEHFSRNDHSIDNFSFLIFQKNLLNTDTRRSIESDLINLFTKLNQPVINKLIRNVNLIKQLTLK